MSDRRRRNTDARVLISGAPEEIERLSVLAAAAIASAPRLASGFEATLAGFVSDTAPARARATTDFAAARPPQIGRTPRGSRAPAAAGTTLVIITVFASIIAAVAPLPARADYEIDAQLATAVSTIAAVVCAAAAFIGVLLPAWGTRESNDQAWKLHYAGAVILIVGMVAGAFGLGDVVPAGTPPWLAWFGWCAVALGATVLGAEVRRRRGQREGDAPASASPAPGSDEEFFASTAERRDRAVREIDRLEVADPESARNVDRRWRAAVEAARSDSAVSRTAFDSARSMSAFRWQLERAAQPEFE